MVRSTAKQRGSLGRGIWLAGLATLSLVAAARAEDDLGAYFCQLRLRGLFVVAEQYAMSRLTDPRLSPERRTDLVVELSRTLADHAGYASPGQRDELWDRALQLVREERQRSPVHPELLMAQEAFLAAVRARGLRWDVTVAPEDGPLRERWKSAVATAVSLLEPLTKQLESELKSSRKAPEELELFEIRQLLSAARRDLGDVLRDRAALATSKDANRAADLVEASTAYRLGQVGCSDDDLLAGCRLGLAECARLQGDYEQSRAMCDEIRKKHPTLSPELHDAVEACRARTWLDQGEPLKAAQQLLRVRQSQHVLTGELWLVQLQTLLTLRNIASEGGDTALVENLQAEAALALARVAEQAGGSWTRLCRTLWERDQSRQTYGEEIDRLVRTARAEYLGGRSEPAAELYATARDAAQQAQLTELWQELSYTRGSILLESEQFAAAHSEFQQLADWDPPHSRSASAHLLSAYSLGRLYDQQQTQSRRLAYTESLQAHLKRFPADPTADDARFMLAQLEEQRLQASRALPLYLQIAPTHPRYAAATLGAARCQSMLISRLKLLDRDFEQFQSASIAELRRRIEPWLFSDNPWSTDQAETVLRLTQLILNQQPADYDAAQRLLDRFAQVRQQVPIDPQQSVPWRSLDDMALPLRMLSLAGTGRSLEARSLLSEDVLKNAQRTSIIVSGLDRLTRDPTSPHFVDLSELLVAAVQRLEPQRDKLTPAERLNFDLTRVRIYLATGRVSNGLEVAASIRASSPNDIALLEELARLTSSLQHPAAQQMSLELWRQVEQRTQPGTATWLAARVGVIQALLSTGDITTARQLLRLTHLLYPNLEDPVIRQQLDRLDQTLAESKP